MSVDAVNKKGQPSGAQIRMGKFMKVNEDIRHKPLPIL